MSLTIRTSFADFFNQVAIFRTILNYAFKLI
jgi:hypothetical protein